MGPPSPGLVLSLERQVEIWSFPSALIGTLQWEPIPLPSGGAGQTKDEAAGAEKGAQELPPKQGKLGEGLWLGRKSWGVFSFTPLLVLPLPCCVTLSMLLELSELVFLSVKWSYLSHRLV